MFFVQELKKLAVLSRAESFVQAVSRKEEEYELIDKISFFEPYRSRADVAVQSLDPILAPSLNAGLCMISAGICLGKLLTSAYRAITLDSGPAKEAASDSAIFLMMTVITAVMVPLTFCLSLIAGLTRSMSSLMNYFSPSDAGSSHLLAHELAPV